MAIEKQHLVRPRTFRDYHESRLGPLEELPEPLRQQFLQKEETLAAELQHGDALWEWEASDLEAGPLVSGLAILHGGEIVRSWECYRPVVPNPTSAPEQKEPTVSLSSTGAWQRSTFRSSVKTPLREEGVWKTIVVDPAAPTADHLKPAFMTPPPGAKPYHGFPLLEETRQDGYCLGIVTDPFEPDCDEGCTIGDAFVEAPDGSRAGLMWNVQDEPKFAVVRPPHGLVWGTFHFTFLKPIKGMDDLKEASGAILPVLKSLFARFHTNEGSAGG